MVHVREPLPENAFLNTLAYARHGVADNEAFRRRHAAAGGRSGVYSTSEVSASIFEEDPLRRPA
jgi:hypothetical protein